MQEKSKKIKSNETHLVFFLYDEIKFHGDSMNTLFLDALSCFETLPVYSGNQTSLTVIAEIEKKNKQFDRIVLLQNGKITSVPDGIKNLVISTVTAESVLALMIKEAKNSDNVAVFNVGNPFYDENFIYRMLSRHEKYLADYTYGIGYPEKLLPTILSISCLKKLRETAKEKNISVIHNHDYLFQLLSNDINSFDVETFISPIDLRIKRISIGNDDKGEQILTFLLVKNLGLGVSYDDLVVFLGEHSEVLFTTIYGIFLDITNKELTSAIYLPPNGEAQENFMKEMDIDVLLTEFEAVNSKLKLVIGQKYEPLLHPNFTSIINKFLLKGFEIIVETFGNVLPQDLDSVSDKTKLTFVFKIDAENETTYRNVHPLGNYQKVFNNYLEVQKLGFKTYLQIVRTNETESDIENLLKNKNPNIIIRKYSSFCNTLPDRKVVDLSPLKRFECYHLRRDLYIDSTLCVYYCVYSGKTIGNLQKSKLNEIIKKQQENYVIHAVGNISDFCKSCDDYYTFNF